MRRAEAGIEIGPRGLRWRQATGLLIALGVAMSAEAAGPRWVTGPPYFATSGNPVLWGAQPNYFTDPGDLSASVNHAAADAIVAAAASVWNVPTAYIVVSYGGSLAEHVSGANAYVGTTGPVFPSDVQSTNYAAVPIAVIYDSDGSVTDMLLGGGASSPAECRQNGVTESVDSISTAGVIQHAILVLNGRCTGALPQQQLQLQYQLERAFGRVLGLGWSQTNDNVFTGNPQATANQGLHWPIMHPIDIVCGAYTYLCLQQPFTLRDDDVASISSLYPMTLMYSFPSTPPAVGKTWTYAQASVAYGTLSFPTGEGMQGVNVVLQRQEGGWSIPEAWEDVSTVSGYSFQQNAGNPVTGSASGLAESMGTTDGQREGFYYMGWVPNIDPAGAQNGPMMGLITTEAINPLYVGTHAVGPYGSGQVTPSGATQSKLTSGALQVNLYPWSSVETDFAVSDAASNCDTSGDGVESSPAAVVAGGWWTAVLCAHGHSAWSSFNAQAERTATLEVTALDESGLATTGKAMPLIGVWAAGDATGTLPTVAATASAFNTTTLGMTATHIATSQAEGLRFVVADARGDGRPDFAYKARVLYADSIAPASTSLSGGLITISGMGFRAGNKVTVNGVTVVVASWTASTIVAVAPAESAFAANPTGAVDVAVIDLSTEGSTVMTGALTYSSAVAPDQMVLVSAPTGPVSVGTTAMVPFAVRVFLGDGVTPVVGMPVTFSPLTGSVAVQLSGCAATPCVLLTDSTGTASTLLTATAFGTVSVQAVAMGSVQTATLLAVARSVTILQSEEYIAAGATAVWTPQVSVIQNGAAAVGTTVSWIGSGAMTVSPGTSLVGATGVAQTAAVAGPLAAGVQATGQACAWTIPAAVCAIFAAVGVDPSAWRLELTSGTNQSIALAGTFAAVGAMVTDTSSDPVASSAVFIYQTASAVAMPCPTRGRCPVAPLLADAPPTSAVSNAGGLISVVPMQIAGVAEVTKIAMATGTQGFATLSIQQGP
jgi:hypothetical protein